MHNDPVAVALRHARVRTLGMPLFALGLIGLAVALVGLLTGSVGFGTTLLYVACTGVSLGVFGIHNDTALAFMIRAPREKLPAELRRELEAELREHRAETQTLVPMPRMALFVTLLAVALHAVAATRLLG